MEATEYDQQKLYKLIRKQRCGKGPANVEIDFSSHSVPQDESECNKWAKFYEDLATTKDDPEFDSFCERSARLKRLIMSMLPIWTITISKPNPSSERYVAEGQESTWYLWHHVKTSQTCWYGAAYPHHGGNNQEMLQHRCLYEQSVQGETWQLFNNFYLNIWSKVKWKQKLSESLYEGQGKGSTKYIHILFRIWKSAV